MSKGNNSISWISVCQGWAIALVVLGHGGIYSTSFPVAFSVRQIIYGFHMPLFFFLSGFLLYYSRIGRGVSFSSVFVEKVKRLYVPFLFFTLVYVLFKLILGTLAAHPFHFSERFFIDTFVLYRSNPNFEMWFLVALFVIMLLYPLYRWIDSHPFYEGTFLLMSCLLSLLPAEVSVFQLSNVFWGLPFFYFGILACKYDLFVRLTGVRWLFVSVLLFAGLNIFSAVLPRLLVAFGGIVCSVLASMYVSRYWPALFSSFRNYSYQIFLLAVFPQLVVFTAYGHYVPMSVPGYCLFYFASFFLGLYVPVAVASLVKKGVDNRYLNLLFGIK